MIITVARGSVVEWTAAISTADTATDLLALNENPALRPVSNLDPLLNTTGWDGGFMVPGQSYRRTFAEGGTYPYTDSAGHSGVVVVTGGSKIYLPLILKN